MRILYVVPNVPSRLRIRPFNFIRRLSEQHEVTVLCVATNEADYRSAAELKRHCKDVEVFVLTRWRSFWNCMVALFSSRALRTAYFYSPRLRRRVEEKVASKEVDIIHAEHLKTVPMVAGVSRDVPVLFDAVDCVSMMETRRRKVLRSTFMRIFSWAEEKKMRRWETWASKHLEGIIISSAVDKECYPRRPHSRHAIRVVPNCVDFEYFNFEKFESRRDTLIFCANLAYSPNEDAVLYLTHSIWPILRARRPNLRLEIVGSRPSLRVEQLDGRDNIRVTASVPDVRPYVRRAWVALCPVRVQAGTQNKILEAMALGVPVVATRACCAGLAVEPGRHILIADTPEEFVSAIELLLDDDALRSTLARAGRMYVEENHDWGSSTEKLLEAYAEVSAGSKTKIPSTTCDSILAPRGGAA